MNKIVGIHQPNYIPWLGYFFKIAKSDIFVFLDDAQYSNNGSHNYHNIKTPQGKLRLKIPVEYKLGNKINEVRTKDELDWKKDHLNKIQLNYKRAPFYDEIYNDFEFILIKKYNNLSELNIELIKFICLKFNITTKFINSSDLNLISNKEEKVLDICSALNATTYLSGVGAKAYQKEDNFLKKNIILRYSEFKPKPYKQLWNSNFLISVSIIDFLMNYGYNWDFVINK